MTTPTLPKVRDFEKYKLHVAKDRTSLAIDTWVEERRRAECPLPNETCVEANKAPRPFSQLNFGALPQLSRAAAKFEVSAIKN